MSTTFGSTPGVEVTVRGNSIVGVEIGREQKLVIFGRADLASGVATANDPTQVVSQTAADDLFGDGSELANALRDALGNGANPQFLFGVAVETRAVSGEAVSSGSGTLADAPVVEDASSINVQNVTAGQSQDVVFRYGSPPDPSPLGVDEIALNPLSGEFEAGDSDDYSIDYDFLDFGAAFDAADDVLLERETGVYVALSESESVASTLSSKVTALRDPAFKMVRGVSGAEPTTTAADGDPEIETASYTDALDNDALFLIGNARQEGTTETLLGAAGGKFGGNDLTNPVFNGELTNVSTTQRLTAADRGNLRQEAVIPIRSEGRVELSGNLSTSTETDFERDFFTRRVVDQAILIVKQVGEGIIGRRNTATVRDLAAEEAQGALEQLADDGLIEPNRPDETNLAVTASEVDSTTVGLTATISPVGVAKSVDATIEVDTN
jgi:hypothetical protein